MVLSINPRTGRPERDVPEGEAPDITDDD